MSCPIKFFDNTMQGAPTLDNNWGSLTTLLDACLVTGFNAKTIASLTSAAGVATVTITAGHLFQVNQVVAIAGVDQSAYNGEFRVTARTSNTFTFDITGSPTSPATGTMSVKAAPLGFEIAFTGTSKRAYRSTNVLSNKPLLRVDDSLGSGYTTTYAKKGKVTLAQSMSDIDTFTGARAPYDASVPTKNEATTGSGTTVYDGWYKWYYAKIDNGSYGDHSTPDAGNREWTLIGDDRGFYFFPQWTPVTQAYTWGGRASYAFTDFQSYRASDGFNTILAATEVYNTAALCTLSGATANGHMASSLDFAGKVILRDHTQVGGYIRAGIFGLNTNNTSQVSGRTTSVPWPNGPDYSLIVHPAYIRQESPGHIRGKMPGLLLVYNDSTSYLQGDLITGVTGYLGKTFKVVRVGYATEKESAMMLFDLTGPWW